MTLTGLFQASPPDVAVEISGAHVGAARLGWRGTEAVVAAHATEALPPGAVVPSLSALNMPDVAVVGQVIARLLSQLGGRPSRVALVVPDVVAKVSLLKLESIPAKASDLQEIVRWQMRKSAPFPMEQAVLSVSPGAVAAEGGHDLVVTLARADVVQQYEDACRLAGAHAGLVDLSSCAVINGVLASHSAPVGDWLLVHVADTYLTLAVVRDGSLLFFRNRTDEAEGTLADLIHQTAMYYEDRLSGKGFARVLLAGGARLPDAAAGARRGFEQRLGIATEPVDPRAAIAVADRISASPELLDILAPLAGMLLRERRVA